MISHKLMIKTSFEIQLKDFENLNFSIIFNS
jgi:hypothetical protein